MSHNRDCMTQEDCLTERKKCNKDQGSALRGNLTLFFPQVFQAKILSYAVQEKKHLFNYSV